MLSIIHNLLRPIKNLRSISYQGKEDHLYIKDFRRLAFCGRISNSHIFLSRFHFQSSRFDQYILENLVQRALQVQIQVDQSLLYGVS